MKIVFILLTLSLFANDSENEYTKYINNFLAPKTNSPEINLFENCNWDNNFYYCKFIINNKNCIMKINEYFKEIKCKKGEKP